MHVTPPPGRLHGDHAVVIGASISGLVAARVLAAHFERVTLFDRDGLPDAVENRRAVPQGRHGHGLLASGLRGLTSLFPMLEHDLLDGGAIPGDVVGSIRWYQHGYYKARFASGFAGLLLSRPLLETTIRRQVRQIPNVHVVDDRHVLGLVAERGRVRGVSVRRAGEEAAAVEADLVVDAGGRGSRSPDWLEELGYPRPSIEEVPVNISYTTRTFVRRPEDLDGDCGVVLAPTPPHQRRVGFMLAMEGGRWMVSMGGWLGTQAPADPDGFVEFARSLPRPDIYQVIKNAEPLTDAVSYTFPSNLRRRYERYTRFPKNYLVIGDALCSFNPLYGQGMSVATLEALALADCLRQAPSCEGLWRPFFKAAAGVIDGPWMIAAGSDFAFAGVTGQRPAGTGLINWYMARVHRAASTDRLVCRTFFEVANLLRPATTLFHPSILSRVWRECVAARPPLATGPETGFDTDRRRLLETQ